MMRALQRTLIALAAMAVTASVSAPELHGLQIPTEQEHHEQARDSIVGEVIEASDEELRVRTEDGRTMTFKVDENTGLMDTAAARFDDEARDRVEDLEAGEKVVVHFRTGDTPDERIAVSVEIRDDDSPGMREYEQRRTEPQQQREQEHRQQQQQERGEESVEGQVVRATDDELVVRTEDGRSMTFKVDEKTRIMDRGEDAAEKEISELTSNHHVAVRFRTGETPGERIATAVEVHGAEAGQQRAQQQQQQQQQRQQQERPQQELRQESVEGQVVQASEDELRLRTHDGRTMTFKIDENTRVMDPAGRYDDAPARERVEELEAGESVTVRFRTGDTPDERLAVAIELRGADDAAARAEEAVRPDQRQMQQQEELPRTSSNLPLVALLGLLGIIGATSVATWGHKRGHSTN